MLARISLFREYILLSVYFYLEIDSNIFFRIKVVKIYSYLCQRTTTARMGQGIIVAIRI